MMLRYIEEMRGEAEQLMAANSALRIATEPRTYTMKGVRSDLKYRIDLAATVDFLQSRTGVEADHFQAMAVYWYPPDHSMSVGMCQNAPAEVGGRTIHYPVIGLRMPNGALPSVRHLNKTFRHELRHVIQADRTMPLYNDEMVLQAVDRLFMGIGGLAVSGLATGFATGDTLLAAGAMCAGSLGVIGTLAPRQLAYYLIHRATPAEIDAELFAYRTRSFMPISKID